MTDPLRVTQETILRARVDPVWFAREILGLKRKPGEPSIDDDPDASWELDDWQIELLEACADVVRKKQGLPTKFNHEGKNLISVRSCQGPGKTFGLAIILHWFGFCYQSLNACTAPKVQQVITRLFKEFAKIQRRAGPLYSQLMEVFAGKIVWQGDPEWFAIAETGAQPENMQGFHGKYISVLCDEASGVNEEVFPVMRGALSTGKVTLGILTGNPTRNTGAFADSHRRREISQDYYLMHVSYLNSKRVSRVWVDQMIRNYGVTSPVVKVRVFGDFADMEEGQLIALAWIAEAMNREAVPDGSVPRRRISIDVADGGVDETVITLATHYSTKTVIDWQRGYSFPSSESPIMAADEAVRLWGVERMSRDAGDDIVVDSLGVGAGTAGSLIQRGFPVITYKGGGSSLNPARFRNIRVQGYIALRDAMRDGTMVFRPEMCSRDDMVELENQLCSIKLANGGERVDDLMTKQEMLRQGYKSPDKADSLAMQFATTSPRLVRADAPRMHVATGESTILEGMVQ